VIKSRSDLLTSHPGTSLITARSRSIAAIVRRYASRSPSASSNGTRYILDHTFSRCSSLRWASARPDPICHVSHRARKLVWRRPADQSPSAALRPASGPCARSPHLPLLKIPLPDAEEPVCADRRDTQQDRQTPRSSNRQVALVPDFLESAHRGHIPGKRQNATFLSVWARCPVVQHRHGTMHRLR
jgi:hypothetical protein